MGLSDGTIFMFPSNYAPPPPINTAKCQLIVMRSGEKVSVENLNSDEINDRHISLNII